MKLKNKKGQTAVEYMLLVVMISLTAAIVLNNLRAQYFKIWIVCLMQDVAKGTLDPNKQCPFTR